MMNYEGKVVQHFRWARRSVISANLFSRSRAIRYKYFRSIAIVTYFNLSLVSEDHDNFKSWWFWLNCSDELSGSDKINQVSQIYGINAVKFWHRCSQRYSHYSSENDESRNVHYEKCFLPFNTSSFSCSQYWGRVGLGKKSVRLSVPGVLIIHDALFGAAEWLCYCYC